MRPTVLQLGRSQVARNSPASIRSTGLLEVGQFQEEQAEDNCYMTGQSFVHRVLGYRGVILVPWKARVHDADLKGKYNETMKVESQEISGDLSESSHAPISSKSNNIKPNRGGSLVQPHSAHIHPYYKVLIDARDQTSGSTKVRAARNRNKAQSMGSMVEGLDYVAHEDILPYTSNENVPIDHKLHEKLFQLNKSARGPKFVPTNLLNDLCNDHSRLELSRVYRQTTENIRVTVIPFYLGCTSIGSSSFYWWNYCVRLENLNQFRVELRHRNLKVFSEANVMQTFEKQELAGAGVCLTRTAPVQRIQSHVNLQHRRGHMCGSLLMEREDGHKFECKIPHFYLDSPQKINL